MQKQIILGLSKEELAFIEDELRKLELNYEWFKLP